MSRLLSDFPDLWPAEQALLAHLQAGRRDICEISPSLPSENPPEAHKIRATFLRYLALGGCDTCRLPETGLRVAGAYIVGDDDLGAETKGFDLDGATLPGDLALVTCRIPDLILLRSARLKSLFLNGSHLDAGVSADRMQAEGDVFLLGAKVTGAIRLLGARLGGDLSCTGATLRAEGDALSCDGMQAEGGVFLRGATVTGAIRLLGARLGGNLDCDGSTLQAEGDALSCDRMQADGGVFLSRATVTGEIRLLGARLGAGLACDGSTLRAEGNALHCDRMQAEGGVFLRGATVTGEIRLLGARLGGDLDCDGATLQAEGNALSASGARIAGAFFLRQGASVNGAIDLTGAELGSICDDPACWPGEIVLDRCRYGAFIGAPVDAASRLRWLALQKPEDYGLDFWPDSYEHCAKVLREAGHADEARTILIEKERLQRKTRVQRLRAVALFEDAYWFAFWDAILGMTVRYGRQPFLAFAWLLGFFLIGWAGFAYTAESGAIKPNVPLLQRAPEWVGCAEWGERRHGDHPSQLACFLDQPEAASYPRFSPFIYSADTLFPVVSLEMQSYWIPDDTQPIGRFARLYLWIHIALGWGLTLLAVAGFSGLIKTDGGK